MSVLMACYLFIFQIPFLQLLFQGYLCDEDLTAAGSSLMLADMPCDGTLIYITRLVSSLILAAYFIFMYLQGSMYNCCNLETTLPWGNLDGTLRNLRALQKLLLSVTFIFDKQGIFALYGRVIAFLLGTTISFKLLLTPVVLDQHIFFVQVFFDLFAAQTFLHVVIAQLSGSTMTVN